MGISVARPAPRTARRDRYRYRRQGGVPTRPSRPDLRDGSPLRDTHAFAPGQLPGTGLHAQRLAFGATFRAFRPDTKGAREVGVAGHYRRGQRAQLGTHQSAFAGLGAGLWGRDRRGSAGRQHGDRNTHSRALGQSLVVRRGARADAAVTSGAAEPGSGRGSLPRSLPGSQATDSRDPVATGQSAAREDVPEAVKVDWTDVSGQTRPFLQ